MSMRGDKRLSLSLTPLGAGPRQTPTPIRSYDHEANIHQDIKITFTLPSGELFEETVNSGETVQEIKRKLHSADKIPADSQFYLGGKEMLNPYSLNDFTGVPGRNALQIEVKVTGKAELLKRSNGGGEGDNLHSVPTTTSSNNTSTNTTIQQQHEQSKDKATEERTQAELVYSGNGIDEKNQQPLRPPTPPTSSKSTSTSTPITTTSTPSTIPSSTSTTTTSSSSTSTQEAETPNSIVSANFVDPDTSSSPNNNQSTIPSHPHAAFDDSEPLPSTPKNNNNGNNNVDKKEDNATTTIDVKDGEEKKIETLGGKRWKCDLV